MTTLELEGEELGEADAEDRAERDAELRTRRGAWPPAKAASLAGSEGVEARCTNAPRICRRPRARRPRAQTQLDRALDRQRAARLDPRAELLHQDGGRQRGARAARRPPRRRRSRATSASTLLALARQPYSATDSVKRLERAQKSVFGERGYPARRKYRQAARQERADGRSGVGAVGICDVRHSSPRSASATPRRARRRPLRVRRRRRPPQARMPAAPQRTVSRRGPPIHPPQHPPPAVC